MDRVDRAVRVSWYDLPQAGAEAWLDWLHGTQLPRWAAAPGVAWVANYRSLPNGVPPGRVRHVEDGVVPAGNAYVLIAAAADAHVFARERVFRATEGAPCASINERVQIFTEEARVFGPAGEAAVKPPAACIQMGSFSAAHHRHEEEILDWYVHNRLAAMRTATGCLSVRKYVSVTGWAKHGVLYEFESLALRNAHFMQSANADPASKAWSDRLVPSLVHAPGSPNVAVRLWPPPAAA